MAGRITLLAKRACFAATDGVRWASSHPAQDRILLQGLVFHGYHGVLEEERRLGQKFIVDAALTTDLRQAGLSDDLNDTVSYATVYSEIKAEVEGPACMLIEKVAEKIAAGILFRHGMVQSVQVSVRKPHVAVDGVVEALGVEITRRRES